MSSREVKEGRGRESYRDKGLLEEDGLEGGVEALPQVLQQDRTPEADSVLEDAQEVAVGRLDDLQPCRLLLVPDPTVCLHNHYKSQQC